MANNKKIIDIFEKAKSKFRGASSFNPPMDVREKLYEEFVTQCILREFDDAMIFTFRDITNDRLSQKLIERISDTDEMPIWNECLITAITDKGIYFSQTQQGFDWEDILSVQLDDNLYIFNVALEPYHSFAIPCACLCDSMIYKMPFKNLEFVKMLNKMAKAAQDSKTDSESLSTDDSIEENSELSVKPVSPKSGTPSKSTKENGPIDGEFGIVVTERNIGEIFNAGNKAATGGMDLSVLSRLVNAETKLESKKKEGYSLSPSGLGDTKKIAEKQERLSNGIKELEALQKKLLLARNEWEVHAYPLFLSACHANTRIILGTNGFNISAGTKGEKTAPGIYTTSVPVTGNINVNHLPADVAEDIQVNAKSLSEIWRNYLALNTEVWNKVVQITGNKSPEPQTTVEDVIEQVKKNLSSAYSQAKKYEEWNKDIKTLESEVDELRNRRNTVMKSILEVDPILTSFCFPIGKSVYTQQWLDRVKEVAEVRKSMPYLPLYWDTKSLGSVFDWKKAIHNGKPNLFIEASTDEGIEGRMDMLDNFIATMLLAFPVKDVHFTVLEQRTINTFVNELPAKICQVFDAGADSEAIRSFTRQLKDMYRAGRDNSSPDCCPREIVVIAGFNKKDRVFSDLMENLNEVIENGKRAGIYFVIVLSKDITEYDWKDTDANNFEQFFTPYATILTNKKDNAGNSIPDYRLLKRDADVETDEETKSRTLADLIASYVKKETETIPNKVYELIENGQLYNARPITELAKQTKKDANQLVIPIASNDDGETINLRLDSKDHIFCMILGASGSGKSYTLHDILTNLMLKYDPATIDVILMDFKGVELEFYKDVPHVSRLMVNGSDQQLVKEILDSISREMDSRTDICQKYGVANIQDYNAIASKQGLDQMKHIVLLVDECQDLFKAEGKNNTRDLVTDIARKGRAFGVHMILATQTMTGFEIPKDAVAQFTDFIFMRCNESDVEKCNIKSNALGYDVQNMNMGELIYYHQGNVAHGYTFDYAGPKKIYRQKTIENLRSSRFPKPAKPQFYFNSTQIFNFDEKERKALIKVAESGLKTAPMGALGKNLSVSGDSLYVKFGRTDGANLLILGTNDLLQGERVLWNAVLSVYDCCKAVREKARFYILPNIPEDVDSKARESHIARLEMVQKFATRPGVNLVDEDERLEMIEMVAATVRGRHQLAETDKKAVNELDNIFLVIPNQQLINKKMGKRPKNQDSLDGNLPALSHETPSAKPSVNSPADTLGFEGLVMSDSQSETTSAPDFLSVDFDSFNTNSTGSGNNNVSAGNPGRDYDEELRYILEYGPTVKVFILLQTEGPDKIYGGDSMREKEMTLLFNDIVLLKMLSAASMSLPVDSRVIEQLSSNPNSLRAVAYHTTRGERTIVPFDIPKLIN